MSITLSGEQQWVWKIYVGHLLTLGCSTTSTP